MKMFKLSVYQYTKKLESQFGFADPEMVKRYAVARMEFKKGLLKGDGKDFNPYTDDPNCKSCGKKSKKSSI
jgi:hypothetical protein